MVAVVLGLATYAVEISFWADAGVFGQTLVFRQSRA